MQASALNHLKQQFNIIGNSPALNRAIEIATQVAPTALSVLITGESGTGKESFSKLIHHLSPYKHGNFIAVNCGAIPEGTIDSELFGHEKGSFTGASESRKGYFEAANGGTIFLDEIGDMPVATQVKLLRVLEYGEFIKVGSSKIHKVSVRVIAATNVDLLRAIYKGKFREDLYYRLNTVPIHIPPLRERGIDIALLFKKFASEFADKYSIQPVQLTEEAEEALLHYGFPGNIRQLKNLVEQISVLELERTIDQKKIQHYLPMDQQLLPTLYKKEHESNNINNSKIPAIWYELFFEVKKEMQVLKKLLLDFFSHSALGKEVIKKNMDFFKQSPPRLPAEIGMVYSTGEYDEAEDLIDGGSSSSITSVDEQEQEGHQVDALMNEKCTYIDKEGVIPDDAFSIEKIEKKLIQKALEKYPNKRKKVAELLGISERTLYRKIKQYNLEEEL